MIEIRHAVGEESEMLSDIAFKSEAYWGYDIEYMEKFRSEYKVTQEFIFNNPTFIAFDGDTIIGFYGLLTSKKDISLEYLFIEPKCIGKGYGKLLWNHMVSVCKKLGINEIDIVTSPQAKEFYMKMGARYIGEVESLLKKGRMIPRLIYSISN